MSSSHNGTRPDSLATSPRDMVPSIAGGENVAKPVDRKMAAGARMSEQHRAGWRDVNGAGRDRSVFLCVRLGQAAGERDGAGATKGQG